MLHRKNFCIMECNFPNWVLNWSSTKLKKNLPALRTVLTFFLQFSLNDDVDVVDHVTAILAGVVRRPARIGNTVHHRFSSITPHQFTGIDSGRVAGCWPRPGHLGRQRRLPASRRRPRECSGVDLGPVIRPQIIGRLFKLTDDLPRICVDEAQRTLWSRLGSRVLTTWLLRSSKGSRIDASIWLFTAET